MEFTLYFDGKLKSNGDAKHKHKIREQFHRQLKQLWEYPPLLIYRPGMWTNSDAEASTAKHAGSFTFVPLVMVQSHLLVELDITMLREGSPGQIYTEGDIDNRLKTLFDALAVPKLVQLPPDAVPSEDQHPFHCLLEDDKLISRISVRADRLLEKGLKASDARIMIRVVVKDTVTQVGVRHRH